MEAKELRIGNWVLNDRVKNTVISINENAVGLLTLQGNHISGRIELIQPIPLTEEWLLKFGFDGYDKAINDNLITIKGETALIWGELGSTYSHAFHAPCKYVHQLQNLYYALTGTELEIKETITQ
jgi:hypothetical protein